MRFGLPFRRPRGEPRVVHQVASWCLSYPDTEVLGRIDLMRAALDEQPPAEPIVLLHRTLDHLAHGTQTDLAREYIDVFDLSRRHTLYLTYWTDGDTRRRGTSLAEFKRLYRDGGMLVTPHGELPDHLPMVLEFSARVDLQRGLEMLEKYRAAVELIKFSLREIGSPYGDAVAAVCATLESPSPTNREAAMAMRTTIPTETVGLEPFDKRLLPISPI